MEDALKMSYEDAKRQSGQLVAIQIRDIFGGIRATLWVMSPSLRALRRQLGGYI